MVQGQDEKAYRSHPALSQSECKEFLRSPAHWLASYGPDAEPRFPSAAMILGTALHHAVLQPSSFDKHWMNRDDKPKEPTVAELKELLTAAGAEFKSTMKKPELLALAFPDGLPVDNRQSLSGEDWKALEGMRRALLTHEVCGPWFDPTQPDYERFNEVSIYCVDPLGITRKARVDRLRILPDRVQILDLKTTDDASPKGFPKSVANFSYDIQAFWYPDLTGKVFPDLPIEFLFAAVEKKRPHGVQVFRASPGLISSGQRKADKALHGFAQCRTLDYWPGYDPVILDIDLPAWSRFDGDSPEEVAL